MHKNLKNLVGKKFGKLLIMELLPERVGKRKEVVYRCVCDCGGEKVALGNNIRSGKVASCGCLTKTPPNKNTNRTLALKKRLYSSLKHNTRNQEKGWSLKFSDFCSLIDGKCFYCGESPINVLKDENRFGIISTTELHYNGIDRVDNRKGYTKNNVVSCCKVCNFCKGQMKQLDFIKQVHKIHNHLWKS